MPGRRAFSRSVTTYFALFSRWACRQAGGSETGNQWIAWLVAEGLIQRAQPAFNGRSITWATRQGVGSVAPNLYRQTTRHEVAVASVSARYLARGYTWFPNRRPASLQDHQVDGVAVKGDIVELIEVELTPKSLGRYKVICFLRSLLRPVPRARKQSRLSGHPLGSMRLATKSSGETQPHAVAMHCSATLIGRRHDPLDHKRTRVLPMLSPLRIPMKPAGAASRPSMTFSG